MNLTLKQMRTIQAIAEHGGITAAAGRLFVTPPAVTQQLRESEDTLGLPLFSRGKGGMQPTEICLELLDSARQIDALLDNFRQRLDAYKGVEGGRLSIGGVSTIKYFCPRLIAGFSAKYPRINIAMRIGNRREVIDSLEGYHTDLCLMGRPPKGFPVRSTCIAEHPHVIIAPPDHPLSGKKSVLREQLEGESFLHREPESGTRAVAEEFLTGLNTGRSIFHDSVLTNESIKQAVMAGLGIALISVHTILNELERGDLALLRVRGTPIVRNWYLVSRGNCRLSPAAQAFSNYMCEEGARQLHIAQGLLR